MSFQVISSLVSIRPSTSSSSQSETQKIHSLQTPSIYDDHEDSQAQSAASRAGCSSSLRARIDGHAELLGSAQRQDERRTVCRCCKGIGDVYGKQRRKERQDTQTYNQLSCVLFSLGGVSRLMEYACMKTSRDWARISDTVTLRACPGSREICKSQSQKKLQSESLSALHTPSPICIARKSKRTTCIRTRAQKVRGPTLQRSITPAGARRYRRSAAWTRRRKQQYTSLLLTVITIS